MRIASAFRCRVRDWVLARRRLEAAVCLSLALLGGSEPLAANEAKLFSNLDSTEGIPHGGVLSLAEDQMGLVWLGTNDGLRQYDGYQLTSYGAQASRPGATPIRVEELVFDGQSRFVAGTLLGLRQLNSHNTGVGFQRVPGLDETVTALVYDAETQETWLGTRNGLMRWHREFAAVEAIDLNWSVTALSLDWRDEEAEKKNADRSSVDDEDDLQDNGLWIGTASGHVLRWRRDQPEDLEVWWKGKAPVLSLLRTSKQELWVGTEGAGLYRITDAKEVIQFGRDGTSRRGLPSNDVTSLLEDSKHQLWVGTRNGLCRFEAVSSRFFNYRHHPADSRSLGSNEIHCLFEDRRKVLWIGHRSGVSRFGLDSTWFKHYRHQSNVASSLGHDAVSGMEVTPEGRLWVGTEEGLHSYTGDGFLRHPLGGQHVNVSVLESASQPGALWVGTRAEGLIYWDYVNGRVQRFLHDSGDQAGLPNDSVTALVMDRDKRLWVGTNDGLARWDTRSGRFTVFRHDSDSPASLAGNAIASLHLEVDGTILVGVRGGGVHAYDDSNESFRVLNPKLERLTVAVMANDLEGNLWLGTASDGVHVLRKGTETVDSFHIHNSALPDNSIRGLVIDGEGHVWISTGHGLARHLGNSVFRVFDLDDGLQSLSFHHQAFCRDGQGRLYFGGSHGLNVIDINELPQRRVARQPVLTGLKMNGQLVQPAPDNPYLQKPIGLTDLLEIPFDKRSRLAFTFATLDYTVPTPSQFRFRMMPMEEEWSEAGKEREASYTGIPSGDYTFEVQASLGGAQWNMNSATMKVRILPPWYLTWWAMVSVGLLILGVFSLTVIYYVRRHNRMIKRQHELLENDRNRAEAALADELQRAMVLSSTAESSNSSASRLYAQTLGRITEYFGAPYGGVYRWRAETGELILEGEEKDSNRRMSSTGAIDPSHAVIQKLLAEGKSLAVADVENDRRVGNMRRSLSVAQIEALLLLPTFDQGKVTGLVVVADDECREWPPEDIKLMETVALQVGRAMAHHQLLLQEKKTKVALQEARHAAEDANRAKSDFLAKMTHELRTPLNSIIGFTQLLNDDATVTGEHRKTLSIINSSGMHLLETVNGILDMEKIEQGQIELNDEAFPLEQFIEDVASMMRMRAQSAGLTVEVEKLNALPPMIRTDKVKLRQIIINFIGNAIKFTKTGGITLRVAALGEDTSAPPTADGKRIRLGFEVADTGCGIAENEVPKLFQKFAQTSSGRRSGQGTGLGLPISKSFIELMGGTVKVRSKVNEGTVFSFDTCCVQLEQEAPKRSGGADGAKVPQLAKDAGEFRILIAEDQLPNRLLLRTLLDKAGFTVLEAENGQKAVELWREARPQLIFMDNDMPVMNGLEATRSIVKQANGSRPTIIFLSAYAIESYRQAALDAGCSDYLTKPFDKKELFEVIARYTPVHYC